MIVRAGGLTLQTPDVMPDWAQPAADALKAMTAAAFEQPDDGDASAAWAHFATLERAAFGRAGARRLRRCGREARLVANRQLVEGWGIGLRVMFGEPLPWL